jgi:hypothetical protein
MQISVPRKKSHNLIWSEMEFSMSGKRRKAAFDKIAPAAS